MLRLARSSLFAVTAAVVLGLGWFHAERIGFYDFRDSFRFSWSLAYVVLLAVAAYGVGLPDLPRSTVQAVGSSAVAAALAATGVSLAQLALGSQLLPRFVVFWTAALVVPLWSVTSLLAAQDRRRQRHRDRVLVVAEEGDAERLQRDLHLRPERAATVLDVLKPGDAADGRLLGTAVDLQASVVVLAREALGDDGIVEQAAELHERGVRVRTLSLFYDEWLGKLPLSELERVALMFDIGEIHRARYGRLKRALDLAVALVVLPLFVAAVPLVAAGDLVANRGPLFFRQARVGRNGRSFTIWKFRTMRPSGSGEPSWTDRDDERVTPFGSLLRRSHLDELPQVVNVLRGDLSTVGPRPEQPAFVSDLATSIRFYDLRHLVRPGVTGWAQVKYEYGASAADAVEKLQYEFWYLRHQGLVLDLRIIGRTLRSVLLRSGR